MPVIGSEKPIRTGSAAWVAPTPIIARPTAARIVPHVFIISNPHAGVASTKPMSDREAALAPLHRDPLDLGHLFHREAAALAPEPAVLDAATVQSLICTIPASS